MSPDELTQLIDHILAGQELFTVTRSSLGTATSWELSIPDDCFAGTIIQSGLNVIEKPADIRNSGTLGATFFAGIMNSLYDAIRMESGKPNEKRGPAEPTLPKRPGKDAGREDWYRYKYECDSDGTVRFEHKDLAEALSLSEGTVKNYYANWKAEHGKADDSMT